MPSIEPTLSKLAPPTLLPPHVELVEVGPRDGLQNEKTWVPTAVKVELIERLAAAGLPTVEATAFVSPKWIPQMADSDEVMRAIYRQPNVHYPVLVPNLRGLEAALAANVDTIAVFVAASESFSQRNINCSIAESLERIRPIFSVAQGHKIRVRGYISCAIGCPYEGFIEPEKVSAVAAALWDLGTYEISLGDTTGVGTPVKTQKMLAKVQEVTPKIQLAGHFHDTYGQALANVYAALLMGITTFDSSIAGLGGCPYAPGASGNLATEDLVYMLEGCGINTGVDLELLYQTSLWISDFLQKPSKARSSAAWQSKAQKAQASRLNTI